MLRRLFCLCVAVLTPPVLTAADVDVYGRLPSIEQAALSPDGTKIAFVKTTQDWRMLAVINISEVGPSNRTRTAARFPLRVYRIPRISFAGSIARRSMATMSDCEPYDQSAD